MNKRQKETLQAQLDAEKAVLKDIERQYQAALKDIDTKIRILESDELTQSRIYRIEYQKALKKQVEATLEKLHSDEYSTINQFLSGSYTNAFVGTMYDLHGQNIPLVIPVDKNAAAKAIVSDTKLSKDLYTSLGVDITKMKKTISGEITRGIASGLTHDEIARNISFASKAPMSRAKTIAQTESHRIQQASTHDAQKAAKAKGADIAKQWDSTLDGKTRDTHRKLDGQIREIDEYFEMDGKKARYPGDFGDPAEDCNCRCVSLQRARKALDEDELNTLKQRAEFFGLDKTDGFTAFKNNYMKAVETISKEEQSGNAVTNKNGDTIIFGKGMDDERFENSVAIIKQLSNEYNTKLVTVRGFEKGENTLRVAGDVSNFGEMRLSSAKDTTAVHEFAHSLAITSDAKMGLEGNEAFWKEIRKVRNEYNKHIRQVPTDKISFYAADSVDEFFAEAFTQAKAAQFGMSLPDYYGDDLTYSNKVLEIVNKYFGKSDGNAIENTVKSGIIDSVEMFKKSENAREGFKFISDEHFNNLTIEAVKNGATILRGTEEIERHLDAMDASASAIGDALLFKKEVCVSEVLEETFHFKQNLAGKNDDKGEPLRTLLNEIEAKEYILSNAKKYKVPRNELELIQNQLDGYKKQLEDYNRGGD